MQGTHSYDDTSDVGKNVLVYARTTVAYCRLIWRERGQTLAEYGLLLTLVAVGVVVPTMIVMRTALAGAFGSATDCILRVSC